MRHNYDRCYYLGSVFLLTYRNTFANNSTFVENVLRSNQNYI